MLIRRKDLEAIRDGRITLGFRRQKRPTVKTGGSLMTVLEKLEIVSVEQVRDKDLTERDAKAAGFDSRAALLDALDGSEGELYRIRFGAFSADPRLALRDALPGAAETADLVAKLDAIDGRAAAPWAWRAMALIHEHPAMLAETIANKAGFEKHPFKSNVRKLKALGLTISLDVGYRLSPRGLAVLAAHRKRKK